MIGSVRLDRLKGGGESVGWGDPMHRVRRERERVRDMELDFS